MLEPFRSRSGLLALFALQAICAGFFLYDAALDIFGIDQAFETRDSDTLEYLIVFTLLVSLAMTFLQFRALLRRNARVESQLSAASGAFHAMLEESFAQWGLTVSERDVALLAIKGLGIHEIAEMRQTRDGTVKAQLNAIYRKAGVSGRPQLISVFVEDLMGEGLVAPAS